MTSLSNSMPTAGLAAFGWTIIPESCYQDLVSGNQLKRDHVQHLESVAKERWNRIEEIQANSLRQAETIQYLREQLTALELADKENDTLLNALHDENVCLKVKLQTAQQELDAIKENYRKVLATNAELDLKLSDAIADLSRSEQQYNEQTVQMATLETSRKSLLTDFDNSKLAVNIELDNHRISILKALDNLELSLRNVVKGDRS